ncbi:MAG: hypothetical protein ABSE27_08545 [Acidobacteriaceae bacterium]|jgi:hypothetical protein
MHLPPVTALIITRSSFRNFENQADSLLRIWRGGYNSGKVDSTNNLYLNTECGINRVSVRSTLSPGMITVSASRPGLQVRANQARLSPSR